MAHASVREAPDVQPLLSHQLPLDRFPDALKLAGGGDALKVQIQPGR